MKIKDTFSNLKYRLPFYIFLVLILVFLYIVVLNVKVRIEGYTEKWFTSLLRDNLNLDVSWDEWRLGVISSNLKITGVKANTLNTDDMKLMASVDKIDIYINPVALFRDKTIDIKDININGLKLSLMLLKPEGLDKLKPLFAAVQSQKSGETPQAKVTGGTKGWGFRLHRLNLQGKEVSLELPASRVDVSVQDFICIVPNLHDKGLVSFQVNLKGGRFNWRGLDRRVGYCKVRGGVSKDCLRVYESSIAISREGSISWRGDLKKGEKGFSVDGDYSGVLFCDTLSYFLPPFRQMRGKVISSGHVKGAFKGVRVDAEVRCADFFWREHNFKKVEGRFEYSAGVLTFKGFKGIWRKGDLRAASQVFLRDRKASIEIHAMNLPTDAVFKDWSQVFPLDPPIWAGDLAWKIEWPHHSPQSSIVLNMQAPCYRSGRSLSKDIEIETTFEAYGHLLNFDRIKIILGQNVISAAGEYNKLNKHVNFAYTCDILEDDIISRLWALPLKAKGIIKGDMGGTLASPAFSGLLATNEVKYNDFRLDRFIARYAYEKGDLALLDIDTGRSEAKLTGNVRIGMPFRLPVRDLECTWSASDVPLSEVLIHIPYRVDFPCKGRVSGTGGLKITGGEIGSCGTLRGEDVTLLGQEAVDIGCRFNISRGLVTFKDILVHRGNSLINAEFLFDRDRGLTFRADTSAWVISPVQFTSGAAVPIRGVVTFDINGKPRHISGRFKSDEVSYNGYIRLPLSGNVNLSDHHLEASFLCPWGTGDLEVNLFNEKAFKIAAHLKEMPIIDSDNRGIIGLKDPNADYSVMLTGGLELKGLLTRFTSIQGRFKGKAMKASGPFGGFEAKRPFEVIIENGGCSVPSLLMQGDKGDLEVKGTWDIRSGFDINGAGMVSLEILRDKLTFIKGITGDARIDLNLSGTAEAPRFLGKVSISHGGFSVPQYNLRADDMKGVINLTREFAEIENLSAQTSGGGWIEVKGIVRYQGKEFRSFDLLASFEDIYIYKRNVYRAYLEGELEWSAGMESGLITGDVVVREAMHSSYKNILELLLEKKREIETTKAVLNNGKGSKGVGKWGDITEMSVQLDLGDDFWIKSPFYNAALTGTLLIKGALSTPWLYGDIEVNEGDVYIGSQIFNLASGRIKLTNPQLSEPTINSIAFKDLNGIRLRLSIFGPIRDPKLQFSSTPYMSQPEILNMVFFGLSTEDRNGYQQESDILSLMFTATGRVLDDVLGEKVSYYTGLGMLAPDFLPKDLFKVDILDLKLQEEGGGVERLTLGKTLSRRLKIKYSRLTGEEEREIAEAEYILTDHVTLIGAQDNIGAYSLDVNFGFRF